METMQWLDQFYTNGPVNISNVKRVAKNADNVEVVRLLRHRNGKAKAHHWNVDFDRIYQVPDPRMPMEQMHNIFQVDRIVRDSRMKNRDRRDYEYRPDREDDWKEQPWSGYDAYYDYTRANRRA